MKTKKTTGYYTCNSKGEYVLEFISNIVLLNEKSDEIERNSFDSEGELVEKQIINYSEDGVVLSYTTSYIENGTEDTVEHVLDDLGRIVVSVNSFSDGETEYERHYYSEEGNKIETAIYNEKEELQHRMEYQYDQLANLTKEIEFDKNGIIMSSVDREYNGKQVVKETFYIEETLNEYVIYELDDKNEFKSLIRYGGDNLILEKQLIIEKELGSITIAKYGDGTLTEEDFNSKIFYDKNDLMIASISINEKYKEEVIYEYDEAGRNAKELYTETDDMGVQKSLFLHVYEEVID